MKSEPTVAVAISAYNEEKNIKAFLRSVTSQVEDGFKLKTILVYSDGSTDDTVKNALLINDKRIITIKGRVRIGKSSRLNEIYKRINTDVLVQSDADVIWEHKYVLRDMVKPLISKAHSNLGMCGGNPLPLPASTFTEKAINLSCDAYIEFRHKVRGGDNVFSVDGRMLSYKKEVYKKFHIPSDMIANDVFTYFSTLSMSYKYKYVRSAIALFKSPLFLKDHIRQNTRFVSAPLRMEKYFARDLVRSEMSVPQFQKIAIFSKHFVKAPIFATYIFVVNLYCKYQAFKKESYMTAIWDMAWSSKDLGKENI